MTSLEITEKVEQLSDIELAMLLSLTANQHALLQADHEELNDVQHATVDAAKSTFGLASTVLTCSDSTTLEDFAHGLLVTSQDQGEDQGDVYSAQQRIANVVIARDLPLASHKIQMQALELLRTKRIFTHTAFYSAPKVFLFVIISDSMSIPLVNHLNSHVFLSHYHIKDQEDDLDNDDPSSPQEARRNAVGFTLQPLFSLTNIDRLVAMSQSVVLSVEMTRYIHDIVVFLRMHRAVLSSSITPAATKYFTQLSKCLAPLHGLKYVTPSLVALAARKVYRHRLVLVAPENERSMQYGSNLKAVAALLEGYDAEIVIDEVLASVDSPV